MMYYTLNWTAEYQTERWSTGIKDNSPSKPYRYPQLHICRGEILSNIFLSVVLKYLTLSNKIQFSDPPSYELGHRMWRKKQKNELATFLLDDTA